MTFIKLLRPENFHRGTFLQKQNFVQQTNIKLEHLYTVYLRTYNVIVRMKIKVTFIIILAADFSFEPT